MHKLFLLVFLLVSAGLGVPAAAQTGAADLPPRPAPFRFVNDEAQLMAPADAKKLEGGLRRYADNTGTQVVVVTVPSLGGRDVADYGRALGTAWGVGQKEKNNGVVVLIGAKDHKLTIQAGSGLQSVITPEVTNRIIGQMTPSFKQGNYFAGLRTGLNTLMLAANPSSDPRKQAGAPEAASAGTAAATGMAGSNQTNLSQDAPANVPATDPVLASPPTEPVSSGPGIGILLIGALLVGGVLWFLVKMFRRRSAPNTANAYPNNPTNPAPDFLPNQPNGPNRGPAGNFNQNQGYGQAPNMGGMGGGMGMGGMLATGAAAAAGAYLGNRMASGHDTGSQGLAGDGTAGTHVDPNTAAAGAAGAAGAGTSAAGDYFSSRDGGGAADNSAPDYFSNDAPAENSSDYFSSDDNSTHDDTSSGDTGGGGFDGGDNSDNSGSW